MIQKSPDDLTYLAYQEAGHAVMFFLIDSGYTEGFIPFSRANILPALTPISLQDQRMNWGEITFSLGSLITVPQVLLAGTLAEQIRSKLPDHEFVLNPSLANLALHFITCHVQEYGSDGMSVAESNEIAEKRFEDMANHVKATLYNHWSSVEALAAALLAGQSLSKEELYQIIEKDISLEKKEEAKRRLKGDHLDPTTRKWIEELRVKHRAKAKNKTSDHPSNKE